MHAKMHACLHNANTSRAISPLQLEMPTFEHQEAVMDIVLQLCRLPSFLASVYINYDCNLYCENLGDKLIGFLERQAQVRLITLVITCHSLLHRLRCLLLSWSCCCLSCLITPVFHSLADFYLACLQTQVTTTRILALEALMSSLRDMSRLDLSESTLF